MMTFLRKRWPGSGRWLLVAMLGTLHLVLWLGVQSPWVKPLMFVHLGLFLMWQPLWRDEESLSTRNTVVIITLSVLALIWLNWWMLAIWVSGLFALFGGRVFSYQSLLIRLRYLIAMGYLLSMLLFWLAPKLFDLPSLVDAGAEVMTVLLPLLLFVLVFLPQERERLKQGMAVDMIYSILLFALLTMLLLGSLAFMTLGHVDYYESLMRTLFVMGLLLFVLGWLWNPRMGFSGFQALFSRSFLDIGTPFENWMKQLAVAAQQAQGPEIFLKVALEHLVVLPWVVGLKWQSGDEGGMLGKASAHDIVWADKTLHLQLFTRQRVAPTVLMHVHLLCQMLAHFYNDKRREQRLREFARLQAVHETGSRLTHDLKNMLQSLLTLISIAEQKPTQAQAILLNQLPVLAKQVETTLNKLKLPKQEAEINLMPLLMWKNNLQQRQQYRDLNWKMDVDESTAQSVPAALFDSIADNLIDNARNKRLREPDIKVEIRLSLQPLRFTVCDSGSAVPEAVASKMFHTVMDSEDGLGVGLFQAARWAEQLGYHLTLVENKTGSVCFELIEFN